MDTRVLQRAEIIIPSVDISLLKKLAQKFGWSIQFKEEKNKIEDIDDLMDHLLK